MRAKSFRGIISPILGKSAAGVAAALLLSACGGGDGGGTPMSAEGSYNLQAAMTTLLDSGLTQAVKLSGDVIVNGTSNPVTGTGTLTLSPGATGMFNGTAARLQTETVSGTVTAGGQTAPYSVSMMNAYEPTTPAILGASQSTEFDVAQAPIVIPAMVGTSATMLGTLSRYKDSTLSVALGTEELSVAVTMTPVDPGGPEVVQFTYKIYDTGQTLVETDTYSYNLTQDNVLSFSSAGTQAASGTLTLTPQ